jgi:catechol 2,3-dioxygenase-like lactoylglutathione lyase family enzyme
MMHGLIRHLQPFLGGFTMSDPVLSGLGAITILVQDVAQVRTFYGDVIGLPLLDQGDVHATFGFGNTMLNFLHESEGDGLIGPATVAPASAGTRTQLTVFVDDVRAVIDQLAAHGVSLLNGPFDRPWGKRTACFVAPEGTVWEIAQDI